MQKFYPYDSLMVFRAAGQAALTADNANIGEIDFGAQARFDGVVVVGVESIAIDGNDELYEFILKGSNDDFSTEEILGLLTLGATEVRPTGAIDSTTGVYEIHFSNEVNDVIYQKVRLELDGSGTSFSIGFFAHMTKRQ